VDTVSHSISPEQLAGALGRPDAPLVLDVRRPARFDESQSLLPGARYCAPEDVARFAAEHPPGDVVVYCVYGHEVGKEAAATLRKAGWTARFLAGGIEGGQDGVDAPHAIAHWRAQAVPRLRKRPDLGVTGERPSRWITRERPKIDRIACPWLVRRFIDPGAEFFYVPTHQVLDEARRRNAVAYDIPGAPISHEGDLCSFDTLLRAFDLKEPVLLALARIVRGADTDRLDLAPQSAGLMAISLGFSRLHSEDDHAMLHAAMPVYDALYAWCRSAQDEPHSWNPNLMKSAKQ
jgi:rhodanese-related sulfurtransferase